MFKILKQFIKFGFVGVLNTIISLAIYYLFVWFDNGLYIVGNIVGFIVSTLNSYLLNSKFVFSKKSDEVSDQKTSPKVNEIVKTYLSYGISLGLSTLLLYLEVQVGNMSEKIAPLINLLITIPLNFCMNKFWVYKKREML